MATGISLRHALVLGIAMIGDLSLILGFAGLGAVQHGLPQTDTFIRTALPFAGVWLCIAASLGAYKMVVLGNNRVIAWRIPLTWIFCGVLAVLLRSVWLDRALEPSFVLISIGLQGVLLVGWRFILAVFVRWAFHL